MNLIELLKKYNSNYGEIATIIYNKIKGLYITGDIHGVINEIEQRFWNNVVMTEIYIDKTNLLEEKLKEYYEIRSAILEEVMRKIKKGNKEDIIIIVAGDFGLYWDNEEASHREQLLFGQLKRLPYTVLWVDGNHENHARINKMKVSEKYGGKVHKCNENCYHLMRGEVYEIKGKKIFTFGGADSHDIKDGIIDGSLSNWREIADEWRKQGKRYFRIDGISWWKEEAPSVEEMKYGLETLKKHNSDVDYIITHCPTEEMTKLLFAKGYLVDLKKFNNFTKYLQDISDYIKYKHFYSGHMHIDRKIDEKHTIVYHIMEKIG